MMSKFLHFVQSLGESMDVKKDGDGFNSVDDVDGMESNMTVHRYAKWNYEMKFYSPSTTQDSKIHNSELKEHFHDVIRASDVMIVWNTCQQMYQPGTLGWQAYNLPLPTSKVVLIVDPIDMDRYRIRVDVGNLSMFHNLSQTHSILLNPGSSSQHVHFYLSLIDNVAVELQVSTSEKKSNGTILLGPLQVSRELV